MKLAVTPSSSGKKTGQDRRIGQRRRYGNAQQPYQRTEQKRRPDPAQSGVLHQRTHTRLQQCHARTERRKRSQQKEQAAVNVALIQVAKRVGNAEEEQARDPASAPYGWQKPPGNSHTGGHGDRRIKNRNREDRAPNRHTPWRVSAEGDTDAHPDGKCVERMPEGDEHRLRCKIQPLHREQEVTRCSNVAMGERKIDQQPEQHQHRGDQEPDKKRPDPDARRYRQ